MPPKRKKRFHGLYYHSSPPRVLPMNGQTSGEIKKKSADDFSIRLSTIRIWMHEKDISKLTRVLWAGQGNKLRQQASTNPKVKRFLAAVPYAMNSIKDVHQSVIDNSLETLQANMEPPVPPSLITCKDANGLNVIHKAAGLGHTMILEYLLSIWPDGANETDMTGKTPLHWAASAKNNMRCYTLLTQAGCEEDVLDYKMKTPAYYKQKHNEIERSFLTLVPEAPRVSQDIPTDWEALSCDDNDKKSEIKIPNGNMKSDVIPNGMNLLTSRSEANSIENISEPDLFEGISGTEEPAAPTPPSPPPLSEEPDDTDPKDPPLENGHLINGNGHISEHNSEPPTPPKTPDEKLGEDEEQIINESAEPHIDENVSNALNDQNNDHQANGINEDEDNTNEEAFENVDHNYVGEHENQEDENGNAEENNNEVNGHDDGVKNDQQVDDSVETNRKDEENDTKTNLNENNEENDTKTNLNENKEENEVSAEETDVTEKTKDETENLIENNKENDLEDSEENVAVDREGENDGEDKDKDKDEYETEGATEVDVIEVNKEDDVVVDNDAGGIEHEGEIAEEGKNENEENALEFGKIEEQQNNDVTATEADHCPVEIKTETDEHEPPSPKNTEPEDPQQEKPKPEDAPVSPSADQKENDDENNNVKNESKTKKREEQDKENDEDDDDQDVELAAVNATSEDPPQYEGENIPEFDDKMTTDSPTPSLAIEGFIAGDSEDYQVQSESAAYLDDEEKYIEAIIESGDMEQLAALVLNGDGKKILNRKSTQPEIQAFLNNVPAYMNKISRVHEAARQGTLYQLQSALDRRKFAIAKDEMSPFGASPLHVAVLFGHAEIVRYLAGRFPETTSAVDDDGRTALHYAATIKDNGHFFNLLVHLGGNPKATDKLGNTAELYTNEEQAKDILTYKQLLRRFGAEELEDEMLSDQGLGDPLIKGLTEIADKRPSDPVAYLAGFLQNFLQSRTNNRDNDTSDTNSTALVNSEPDGIDSPVKTNGTDLDMVEERISSSPEESTPKSEDRDEHGQSLLHFACARSHRRNGLLNLVEESHIDVTYRDELYRTARDVSLQANQPGNAKEIDRYVLSLAVVGDTKPFENMALSGYDHILDVVDDEGSSIIDLAQSRGHDKLVDFLSDLRNLEEMREELHQAIRQGDFEKVKEITASAKGKWLIKAKNYYGRTALHIAVLKELEEIVEYFVSTSPDALKYGDNLERTPLHYAMGTNSVEGVSRILIRKGAKRTIKDLKGRQPSYYFMNKADILRLQEEEDEHR